MKNLDVANLGYYNQSRLNRGDSGDFTMIEFGSKADVIVINHLLRELGFDAISIEDAVIIAGKRTGRMVTNMPWSKSLELQSAWHSEIIPVVSGERQKQIDAKEAHRRRIEKVKADREAELAAKRGLPVGTGVPFQTYPIR